MPDHDTEKFDKVATVLSGNAAKMDEIYEHLKATLAELFNSEAFVDFELVDNDLEYEGGPKEHWAITFQVKQEEGDKVIRQDFKSVFVLSARRDGSIIVSRGDTLEDIAIGSVILRSEDIHENQTLLFVNGHTSEEAAAAIIEKLCTSSGMFSDRLEQYAEANPDRIRPPQYSPYHMNGG